MKRIFDVVISLIGLFLLSPILGLIALAIRKDSPGPIFFYGSRMGRGGKVFKIVKFRTMYEVQESYQGPRVTAHNDPRITKLGRWLRDTKLNELPQLLNVLTGDMSLVGPRPEDPEIVETWPKEIRDEILSVRPGITSPASVEYRNEEFLLSYSNIFQTYFQDLSPDKMRMDQLYVRNRSICLDLDTLFWTFLLLLPKLSSHTLPEKLLFVGPFTRLVRQHIPWFAIDSIITFGSIAFAGILWRITAPLDVGWPKAIAVALGFSLLFSLIEAILGVNRISWSKAPIADGVDLLPAWLFSTLCALITNEVSGFFPTKMVLFASVFALFGYVAIRYRGRLLSAFMSRFMYVLSIGQAGRERVLIVGGGVLAQHAVWMLTHPSNIMKYWIVGIIDNDLFKQGRRIYGVNVVGVINDIPKLAKEYDVGVIILADQHIGAIQRRAVIDISNKTNAKLLVLPNFLNALNTITLSSTQAPIPVTSDSIDTEIDCRRCMTKYASQQSEASGGQRGDTP